MKASRYLFIILIKVSLTLYLITTEDNPTVQDQGLWQSYRHKE